MENATKALTMAAGVLIAIMVIALIYLLIDNISETSEQDEQALKAQQTAEFNRAYESYDKPWMRGTEVISVINKAVDNNLRYSGDEQYQIRIEIELAAEIEVPQENGSIITVYPGVYNETSEEYKQLVGNEETLKILKRKYFRCTDLRYNSDARVNYMSFAELDVNQSAMDSIE